MIGYDFIINKIIEQVRVGVFTVCPGFWKRCLKQTTDWNPTGWVKKLLW